MSSAKNLRKNMQFIHIWISAKLHLHFTAHGTLFNCPILNRRSIRRLRTGQACFDNIMLSKHAQRQRLPPSSS